MIRLREMHGKLSEDFRNNWFNLLCPHCKVLFTVGVSQTVYRCQKSSSSSSLKYEKELKEHGNMVNLCCRTQMQGNFDL